MTALPTPQDQEEMDEVFVLPASFAQQRLWFLEQLEPGRATYNVPLNLRLTGQLDVPALAGALTALVERHETLRTVFDAPEGEVMQVILPAADVPLPVEDLRSFTAAEREKILAQRIREEGTLPFNLAQGAVLRACLLQLADDEHVLLLTAHHIAVDGWSLNILQRELGAAYAALARGVVPEFAELPIQYADYAAWQREHLDDGSLAQQMSYWTTNLAAPLPSLDLPTDHVRTPLRDRFARAIPVEIPADVSDALIALGRQSGATSFAALLAAYHVLLHRYTGQDDVIVGSPVAGRSRRETEGLIGLFVNTLVVRADLSGGPTFRTVMERVRDSLHGALANPDVPFERIVDLVQPDRDRSRNPIFQTLFSLQDFTASAPLELAGLTVARLTGARTTAKFDLQLIMTKRPGGFRGSLEYDASLFEESSALRMMRHFLNLLRALVENPDRPIAELSMLDADERRQVVEEWNSATLPFALDATMHGLVTAQASRTPEAIALVHQGIEVTYEELVLRAGALATHLRAAGVGPEVRVAVCLSRTPHLVVALLGVLMAGGAYVPLDPAYPAARNAFTLEDSGAIVVITESTHARQFQDGAAAIILVDEEAMEVPRASREVGVHPTAGPCNLGYLIYTSGSTGRPKGVAIEHRNAVALIAWAHQLFSREELAGVLFSTSVCFDLSVFELFVPLSMGGTVIIADNALALPTLPDADRVTLVNTVPSAIAALLRSGPLPPSVRTVNLAGEPLATSIVAQLYALRTVTRVYDLYGPSEDTTYSTWALRHPHEPPTIGRPIANTQAYVLDAYRQPVAVGVPGELYLAGAGLARGYHARPELTDERFVADPFSQEPAGRMYRTGDSVRWRPTGQLEYLGRLDHQVKIRGFRVEPGEVQARLEAIPGIRDGAVIVREDARGDKRLLAFYVAADGASVTTDQVRTTLRTALPEYMVPSAITRLDALPLTPNGKLDRAALPDSVEETAASEDYAPPRTILEHELVQIWEKLFPGRTIGIRENFFDIGGHSLLAVQMLFEMEKVRGRRVPLTLLFESGTIEQLALWLSVEIRAEDRPSVVSLQSDKSETPVAFVHGDVRGGGWYSRRLAPLAAPESPFHLLPTLGTEGVQHPWTIESMATTHVASLRTVQPHGPYRLAGFCVGGLVAFEMACQLQAAGEQVDRLIIIDSAAINRKVRWVRGLLPLLPGADENEHLTRQAVFMRRLRWYAMVVRQLRNRSMRRRLEWVYSNVARRVNRLLSRPGGTAKAAPRRVAGAPQHDAHTQEFAEAMRTQIAVGPGADVLLMQDRAASVYFPSFFKGSIDLIWADERAVVRIDPTHGWRYCADRVHVQELVASHLGLVTNELPLLGTTVKAALERQGE
ncbi:MAG: amino acid adenylation domain-containing protein [bacterium]